MNVVNIKGQDKPELKERISQLKAEGLTIEAIALRLNEESYTSVKGKYIKAHTVQNILINLRDKAKPVKELKTMRTIQVPTPKPKEEGKLILVIGNPEDVLTIMTRYGKV